MRRSLWTLSSLLGAALALAGGLSPSPARADSLALAMSSLGFLPQNASDGTEITTSDHSRSCIADCLLVVPVHLPSGALAEKIQLDACDETATGAVRLTFSRLPAGDASQVTLASIDTGTPASAGCEILESALAVPEMIDNGSSTYVLRAALSGGSTVTRFRAARVSYRLQVSPAPATATFGDVPASHPFFQFIEALVASGITAGCSAAPPLYCPDEPLTRGQMAVFLSKGLGLHFAP